jgi:uncharacterized protein YndB with AHSA1/START domain
MTEMSLVRQIAARPATVFEALVGGRFRVRFRTADGLEHECAGEFLEIERPERVVMSWRWILNGVLDEHGKVSRLEIRLRSMGTGTELRLVHSQLSSEDSARGHEGGWDGALKKLTRRFCASLDVSPHLMRKVPNSPGPRS